MNPFPRLRKIIDEDDRKKVMAAVRADNDNLSHASHVWERRGEIVGAASLWSVPVLLGWHHKEKILARDSFHMLRVYESVFDAKGHTGFYILCNRASPYSAHMEQFGYRSIWETEVFVAGTGIKEPEPVNEPVLPANGTPRMR